MEEVVYLWGKLMNLCKAVFGGLSEFVDDMLSIVTKEVTVLGNNYSVLEMIIGGLVSFMITRTLIGWTRGNG